MAVSIIDACALINVINTGSAQKLLSGFPHEVRCQGLVEDELGDQVGALEQLFSQKAIFPLAGDIPASEVSSVSTKHRLGLGESECIAFCLKNDWKFISDDQRARRIAASFIGENRVTGTIGILCNCIDLNIITDVDAFSLLAFSREAGGFLPEYDFTARKLVSH